VLTGADPAFCAGSDLDLITEVSAAIRDGGEDLETPDALRMTKPLLRAAADAPWEHALAMEEYAEANCFSTRALGDSVAAVKAAAAARDARPAPA
jgi:enoyl-CoA hydratase/carnithine racemase